MMKMEGLYFGKGDFHKILDKLQICTSDKFFDIGNKLALLKSGILLKKSEQFDIYQPSDVSTAEGVASTFKINKNGYSYYEPAGGM